MRSARTTHIPGETNWRLGQSLEDECVECHIHWAVSKWLDWNMFESWLLILPPFPLLTIWNIYRYQSILFPMLESLLHQVMMMAATWRSCWGRALPAQLLCTNPSGWSLKENAGHLFLLDFLSKSCSLMFFEFLLCIRNSPQSHGSMMFYDCHRGMCDAQRNCWSDLKWHWHVYLPLCKALEVSCFRAFEFSDAFCPVQATKEPQGQSRQSQSEGGSENLGFVEVGEDTLEQCWDLCQMMPNQIQRLPEKMLTWKKLPLCFVAPVVSGRRSDWDWWRGQEKHGHCQRCPGVSWGNGNSGDLVTQDSSDDMDLSGRRAERTEIQLPPWQPGSLAAWQRWPDGRSALYRTHWGRVVLDEAWRIWRFTGDGELGISSAPDRLTESRRESTALHRRQLLLVRWFGNGRNCLSSRTISFNWGRIPFRICQLNPSMNPVANPWIHLNIHLSIQLKVHVNPHYISQPWGGLCPSSGRLQVVFVRNVRSPSCL